MKEQNSSIVVKASLFVTTFLLAIMPASADLAGGIQTTTNIAEQVKTGMLTIGGIIAVIYLLWKALEAWRGRCDWGEFALSVGYVALAGASAVLANWAWGLFT